MYSQRRRRELVPVESPDASFICRLSFEVQNCAASRLDCSDISNSPGSNSMFTPGAVSGGDAWRVDAFRLLL